MSSRFYPLYQVGNPQMRVFLPNFWMKLVHPAEKQPPNVVQFRVPLAMTDYDIRNYLEKIYDVKVMHVSSELIDGKCYRGRFSYVVKDDDYRRAIVTLPRGTEFKFPDLDSEEIKTKHQEEMTNTFKSLDDSYENFARSRKNRFGLPPWFSC